MALKFAANLNFLFTEVSESLVERLHLAHRAGFRAVEIPYPSADAANEVAKAKKDTGIEVALVNIALGPDDFKFGSASVPGAEEAFKQHLNDTIVFAKTVDCKKIHIMSGIGKEDNFADRLKTYKKNLKFAAKCLESEGLTGVIEPINKYALPNYFMNSYDTAFDILRDINSANLKLMVDIFHLQHIRGNISNTFKDAKDLIGHIQIAQVPNRNEPDTDGELNFAYIFSLIETSGYAGWIGCEYKPSTTTADGLKWISKYGFTL